MGMTLPRRGCRGRVSAVAGPGVRGRRLFWMAGGGGMARGLGSANDPPLGTPITGRVGGLGEGGWGADWMGVPS